MVGGGSFGWEPGEWTDDTSMAIAISEVAATGADLRQEESLDAIARRWHEWSRDAKDVGVQTRSVLSRAGRHGISARTARAEAAALHKLKFGRDELTWSWVRLDGLHGQCKSPAVISPADRQSAWVNSMCSSVSPRIKNVGS